MVNVWYIYGLEPSEESLGITWSDKKRLNTSQQLS